MTTPAIRALKESGGRRIALLTSSAGAAIAPLIPEIDETIIYDAPWLKATGQRSDSRTEYIMAQLLRRYRFDGAVIFTVYSQNAMPSAFICHLADIPLRLAHCRENPYQLLTEWVLDPEPEQMVRHEVQRQLDLVATIGCRPSHYGLSLSIPATTTHRMAGIITEMGIDRKRHWIILHPGATAPSRRYRADAFAEVVQSLHRNLNCQIVLTGTEEESGLVDEIRRKSGVPTYSLCGRLNIAEFGAVISLSSLLISNNTGPVHMAAAVGTPVVDIYALTNPQHAPWDVECRVLSHDVPCRYCYKSICPEGHHNCLAMIEPQSVVQAASALLSEESVTSGEFRILTAEPPSPKESGKRLRRQKHHPQHGTA